MRNYIPPDVANRTSESGDHVVARKLAVGGVLPGLPDLQYINADVFLDGHVISSDGTPPKEGGAVASARITYWDPTVQERLAIACGGMVQVLALTKEQPPLIVNGLFMNRPVPNQAVAVTMARHAMGALNGDDAFDSMKPEEQAIWIKTMGELATILDYWTDQINKGNVPTKKPPEEDKA